MKNLTPEDLKLVRKCVNSALALRSSFVSAYKSQMENNPSGVELKTRQKYSRCVAIEIPQLTALLKKLRAK